MFFQLAFDMERIDEAIKNGTNTIYAQDSNLKEIQYDGIKKGFFRNIVFSNKTIHSWPEVLFYYSSNASNLESEYLLNIVQWPIVHKRVMETFENLGISGIEYYPIKLIDVVTKHTNENYMMMYITNYIDAYDMDKTSYKYNEKYDSYSFNPKQIYLNTQVCEKYDIFRCKKHPSIIYVSQRIKDIIETNKWIGFTFYQQS